MKEGTMQEAVQLGALGQIVRAVRDIKESETWYRDALGLKHLFTVGNLAFFDCGGVRLMLSQEGKGAAGDSLLYFRAPDIRAMHDALAQRGVEFLNSPHMIFKHPDGTEEWLCNFKDPEGRPLGLISQVAP